MDFGTCEGLESNLQLICRGAANSVIEVIQLLQLFIIYIL